METRKGTSCFSKKQEHFSLESSMKSTVEDKATLAHTKFRYEGGSIK